MLALKGNKGKCVTIKKNENVFVSFVTANRFIGLYGNDNVTQCHLKMYVSTNNVAEFLTTPVNHTRIIHVLELQYSVIHILPGSYWLILV